MARVTTFTVEVTHSADQRDAFDRLFGQYLTEPESPFLTDYAPTDYGSDHRNDGFDGPHVLRIVVTPHASSPKFTWSAHENRVTS